MTEVCELNIGMVDPSPWQPRFELTRLEEINDPGDVKIPILVRPKPDGRFELIDGEGRLERLRKLGAIMVRAEVRPMKDREAAISVYRVNQERRPFEQREQARWLARYIKSFGATQEQAAAAAGMDQGSVSRLVEFAKLSGELPSNYGSAIINTESNNKALTQHKLKEIARLPQEKRKEVALMVEKERVSTNDTKVLVSKVKGGKDPIMALVEIRNFNESARQETHQDKRRGAGKKAAPHRNYAFCEDCGDQLYFVHTGVGRHRFLESEADEV